jgi:DnaJ-class molecular chaperone
VVFRVTPDRVAEAPEFPCRDCGDKGAHADGPEDAFACPTCKGTGIEDWHGLNAGPPPWGSDV